MPQSVNVAGGFRATGRTEDEAARVTADAKAVAQAGAFAVVIEGTLEPVAADITRAIDIPAIGIGASSACDGQVLVIDDLLGTFNDFTPRFVRRYADLGTAISRAAAAYAEDVRARRFPGAEHVFRKQKK
jgi:3-methyl-2-oxobutanoate hydroxymethyltransferase